MRNLVLPAVMISILIFWSETPCGFVSKHNASDKRSVSIFSPEDRGSMFLRNVSTYLEVHMVLPPRKNNIDNL
jgi:hypothetical protein